MKRFMFMLFLVPFFVFAQEETATDTTNIIVSEEVNDCINKIHDNPAIIKLFLRNLAQDPDRMRETYKRLVNDPEIRDLVERIRNNFRTEGMKEEKY